MRSQNPDLIILDLGLPDAEGVELLRRIRSYNDSIPTQRPSDQFSEAFAANVLG